MAACSPTDGGCPDICAVWVEVRGTIQTADAAPVAGVDVELRVMFDGPGSGGAVECQLVPADAAPIRTISAAEGTFQVLLQAESIHIPECIELTLIPPTHTGLAVRVDTLPATWSLQRNRAPVIDRALVLAPVP